MVGIQIGREQEEGEREDDAGFEKIEDFNVTSNADEKFCGSDYDDMTFDMKLQLGGERERERDDIRRWRAGGRLNCTSFNHNCNDRM